MACLPLIERELRVALRKQRPAKGRLKVAALATGGSILFLWFGSLTNDRTVGRSLEQILCAASLYYVLRAPMLTAGALAEERRNQTLGLLFLSGLGAGEVFASKFLSSGLIAFTNLLAIFPMLALPFLIGGVSYDLFLAIICGFPVLMLFALAISMLASVLTQEDGAAIVLANVLGVLLCALTPAIYIAQFHFSLNAKPSLWWLRLSPAYGPYLVWRGLGAGFHPGEKAEFWQNLPLTLAWSAIALAAAAFALKRVWREREQEAGMGGWRKRLRDFMHGNREGRQRLARLWLEQNPFVWLAGRDRQPATLGWLVVSGIALVWLLCWAAWPTQWPSVLNLLITATLMSTVLAWLSRHAAAQQLGQARHDGSYELLLTTPLAPVDIVVGELEALRWQFKPLANFVLMLDVLMMLGGLLVRSWNRGALIVYFCVWLILLTWTWSLGRRWSRVLPVMWASLNCARPAHAVWRTSNNSTGPGYKWYYWIWIWNIYNVRLWHGGIQRFPTGSFPELVAAVAGTCLFMIIFLVRHYRADREWDHNFARDAPTKEWDGKLKFFGPTRSFMDSRGAKRERTCRRRLIAEFREIVREPLPDPHDPRFKTWNAQERFPWGWGIVQQQLHERVVRKSVELDR
jgi:hypothetical protein